MPTRLLSLLLLTALLTLIIPAGAQDAPHLEQFHRVVEAEALLGIGESLSVVLVSCPVDNFT